MVPPCTDRTDWNEAAALCSHMNFSAAGPVRGWVCQTTHRFFILVSGANASTGITYHAWWKRIRSTNCETSYTRHREPGSRLWKPSLFVT
jgi:hypothetical protein